MALVLPFVAGLVNAEGFFIVGVYTSHLTGTVARAADALAKGHLRVAAAGFGLVVAFFAGAFIATSLVERARRQQRARYSRALGAEMFALFGVMVLGLTQTTSAPEPARLLVTTLFLSFAMGAQNALVTKLSGAVVRTTHLTGIVTDLGIESVKGLASLRALAEAPHDGEPGGQLWRVLVHVRTGPEFRRLRLHVAIFGSFFTGAVLGPVLYVLEGYTAMMLPVVVLTALILFDTAVGFRTAEPASAADPPREPAQP